jgi:hypothetical protein
LAGRLPVDWQQSIQAAGFGGGQTFQYLPEVGMRLMSLTLHSFDERINHGTAITGILPTHEEPSFPPPPAGRIAFSGGVVSISASPCRTKDLQPGPIA